MGFENLSTVKFQIRMKPAALRIYQKVFGGCKVEDLREKGVKVHILDKEFGIDSLIKFQSGGWITLQEKYRRNEHLLKFGDFTQEYKNAFGTKYESDGEWFTLAAQLYFYGWANKDETDFVKWLILDVAKYKLIIEKAGGIENFCIFPNDTYGGAWFYGIPIRVIEPAFICDYRDYK